jgi:hypothetical protein
MPEWSLTQTPHRESGPWVPVSRSVLCEIGGPDGSQGGRVVMTWYEFLLFVHIAAAVI